MRLITFSTLLALSSALLPIVGWGNENATAEPLVATVVLPAGQSTEASVAGALKPASSAYYRTAPLNSLVDESKPAADPTLLVQADDLGTQAEELALDFDLVGAAKVLREAADNLRLSGWVLFNPQTVGLYHVRAAAASADADEDDLALRYFRLALAIDSKSAEGIVLSPKATGFMRQAAGAGPLQFALPGHAILAQICSTWGLDGIVLITASSEMDETTVTERLYFPGAKVSDPETHHRLPEVEAEKNAWLDGEQQRLERLISSKFRPEIEPPRPWYKRWWIYATVGGAIAAGVVSAFAIRNAIVDPLTDVTVHH